MPFSGFTGTVVLEKKWTRRGILAASARSMTLAIGARSMGFGGMPDGASHGEGSQSNPVESGCTHIRGYPHVPGGHPPKVAARV